MEPPIWGTVSLIDKTTMVTEEQGGGWPCGRGSICGGCHGGCRGCGGCGRGGCGRGGGCA